MLTEKFPEIQTQVPLSQYSSFKIGGPASYFYQATDIEKIPSIIKEAQSQNIPWLIIGGGTNTIFHENGFQGLIIKLTANNLKIPPPNQPISQSANHPSPPSTLTITADAGIILNALILQTLKANLIGMENLFGIPGTLGGAIRGNAGAHGTEIQDLLDSVTIYNPETQKIETLQKEELNFSYRESTFKKSQQSGHPKIILQATLRLTESPEKAELASKEIFQIQKIRNAKYPSEPNCGSFFKNPSQSEAAELLKSHPETPLSSGNIPAGYLTEQANCKGLQIGDAQVSEKHGNFFINKANATQTDLLALKEEVQKRVEEKFQIHLTPEVQFISTTGPL